MSTPASTAELEHVGARPAPVRQRLEAVEDRREHHGRDPDEDHGEPGDDRGAGEPPPAREAADQSHQERCAPGGEQRRDPGGAGNVPEPRVQRLGREADVDRPLVRGEAHRQRHDRGQDRDPAARGGGPEQRPAREPVEPPANGRRAAEGDRDQDGRLDEDPRDHQQALALPVILGALELRGVEVVALGDRHRVRWLVARAQQPYRRLGDHDHRHGRAADSGRGRARQARRSPAAAPLSRLSEPRQAHRRLR